MVDIVIHDRSHLHHVELFGIAIVNQLVVPHYAGEYPIKFASAADEKYDLSGKADWVFGYRFKPPYNALEGVTIAMEANVPGKLEEAIPQVKSWCTFVSTPFGFMESIRRCQWGSSADL